MLLFLRVNTPLGSLREKFGRVDWMYVCLFEYTVHSSNNLQWKYYSHLCYYSVCSCLNMEWRTACVGLGTSVGPSSRRTSWTDNISCVRSFRAKVSTCMLFVVSSREID